MSTKRFTTKMKPFKQFHSEMKNDPCWTGYKMIGKKMKNGKSVPNCVPVKEEYEDAYLLAEKTVADSIKSHPAVEYYGGNDDHHMINLKPGYIHSGLEQHSFSNDNVRKAKKELEDVKKCDCPSCKSCNEEVLIERGADSKGYYRSTEQGAGLTPKGAKHFGIKTAVTTPPSKLKPGSKAAKRRKSFCARMGGMPGPMKDDKGRPTRKAMSLRRWNCN